MDIARDRNGAFDPMLLAKHQRRFREFGRKIISMCARGMTTRENQGHIEDIYGVEASPSLISAITEAVMEEVAAWQNRPPEPCGPIVFMDAIRVTIRSDGAVSNKAASKPSRSCRMAHGTFRAWGSLGFQANEGAKFWAKGLNDLTQPGRCGHPDRRRGRPQGFPQATEAAFPQTRTQTCIVHLARAIP